MKHFSIQVSGKVQGVSFRMSAKAQAEQLGIRGFVRNESTGDVYIEAEGEDEPLKIFLAWCSHGPRHAAIEKITSQEGVLKNFNSFVVRR